MMLTMTGEDHYYGVGEGNWHIRVLCALLPDGQVHGLYDSNTCMDPII